MEPSQTPDISAEDDDASTGTPVRDILARPDPQPKQLARMWDLIERTTPKPKSGWESVMPEPEAEGTYKTIMAKAGIDVPEPRTPTGPPPDYVPTPMPGELDARDPSLRLPASVAGAPGFEAPPPGYQYDFGAHAEDIPGRTVASTAAKPETGDWVVPGLLRRGKVFVLASDEGLGKTQMARELAVRGAGALGSFLNVYPLSGVFKTVVVDEENGEDEEFEREEGLASVLGSPRASWGGNYVRYSFLGIDLDSPSGQEMLEAVVVVEQPSVLVLDTGGQMVGEEHGAGFKETFGFLLRLADRYQLALVVLVHMVKPLRSLMTGKPFTTARAVAEVTGHWTKRAHGVGVLSSADDDDTRFFWRTFKRVRKVQMVLSRADGLWEAEAWAGPAPRVLPAGMGRTEMAREQTMAFLRSIKAGHPAIHGGPAARAARRAEEQGYAIRNGTVWALTEAGHEYLEPYQEEDQPYQMSVKLDD